MMIKTKTVQPRPPSRSQSTSRPKSKQSPLPASETARSQSTSRPKSKQSPLPASETATVQVVVRLRPINEREKKHGTLPVVTASSQSKTVMVVKGSGNRKARSTYSFDNVFSAFSSQEEVFKNTLRPILIDVMQGYESTVFAYGQTGTGKTHTMEGDLSSHDSYGVIPRSAESIFMTLNQPNYNSHSVTCSYLEIYNEELCDLFADEEQRGGVSKVEIMEGKDGTFCRGQTEKEVQSADDVLSLMRKAQQFRKVGETKMNKHSSRSHCLFTLKINAKRKLLDGNTLRIHGKLHLVDLAGSECAKSVSDSGMEITRERERSNINKSLLTLGRVIIMLKEQSESKKTNNMRIPYRDSKLTRLLQKSLGGKCKTLVIATLSPSIASIEESISTLNYAQSANGIVNKPVATSYLSINSSSVAFNAPTAAEGAPDGQTLEHWYEMECRLQYMQTQVEEAQAALARNYMIQQEVVDRAEEAERLFVKIEEKYDDAVEQIQGLKKEVAEEKKQKNAITLKLKQTEKRAEKAETMFAEMEQKYNDAIKEIQDLKLEVAEERKQKEAISLLLKQTEMQLRKTTLILEATQKTEVSLTSEARALIDTIRDSISDGDQLHQYLLDARESDVQRRSATKKFHSVTVTILEDIVSTLSKLSKKEDEYCNSTIDFVEKENKISHQSLDQSLKIMKEITTRVATLTSTIKSHAQDEKGIMPLVSKLSEDVQDGVGQCKGFLMNGEGKLSTSFQTGHKQLKEYSSKLKRMDSEYATSTEHLLSSLDKNFSQSKDKVLNMVASITGALSSVRAANLETRNTLDVVISKLEKDSTELAIHIEDVSRNQSVTTAHGIESFSDGMQHIESMRMKLKKQVAFIDTDGNAHLNDIAIQRNILSNQQESIAKAKKEQKIVKEAFLATVLNGVTSLVNEQMSLLSKNQVEHLQSFENSNQILGEKNSGIGSSADKILGEAKVVNQNLLEHVEQADKNDSNMKIIAQDAKGAFIGIQNTSKDQQNTIKTHVSQASTQMTEMSLQDETVGNIAKEMQTERDVIIERVNKMMEDEKIEVEILTNAAKQQSEYTSNTVIASVLANLVNMEKPRKQLITSILDKLDYVVDTVKEGKVQIESVTKKQCSTADKLRCEVDLKNKEHNNKLAKRCRSEFDACKVSMVTNARAHLKLSEADLSSSTLLSSSTKNNVEDFVSNTIQFKKSVPPAPQRRSFIYSTNLSRTPSSDSIVKSLTMKKVNLTVSN